MDGEVEGMMMFIVDRPSARHLVNILLKNPLIMIVKSLVR